MRIPWGGLAVAAPAAAGGYFAAGYAAGNTGYARVRSRAWVADRLAATDGVQQLSADAAFRRVEQPPSGATRLVAADGAVSGAVASFRNVADARHTITFVHCGPHTVGFPFLVHGGVLGALLHGAAALAYTSGSGSGSGAHEDGTLRIRYRRPTRVDQILRVETFARVDGLDLFVTAADTDSVLVEATYLMPA